MRGHSSVSSLDLPVRRFQGYGFWTTFNNRNSIQACPYTGSTRRWPFSCSSFRKVFLYPWISLTLIGPSILLLTDTQKHCGPCHWTIGEVVVSLEIWAFLLCTGSEDFNYNALKHTHMLHNSQHCLLSFLAFLSAVITLFSSILSKLPGTKLLSVLSCLHLFIAATVSCYHLFCFHKFFPTSSLFPYFCLPSTLQPFVGAVLFHVKAKCEWCWRILYEFVSHLPTTMSSFLCWWRELLFIFAWMWEGVTAWWRPLINQGSQFFGGFYSHSSKDIPMAEHLLSSSATILFPQRAVDVASFWWLEIKTFEFTQHGKAKNNGQQKVEHFIQSGFRVQFGDWKLPWLTHCMTCFRG